MASATNEPSDFVPLPNVATMPEQQRTAHPSSLLQQHSLTVSSSGGVPTLLDSLAVLHSGAGGAHSVGGAREGAAMSLSHVLSGLQEEGDLVHVLQEQPNALAHVQGLSPITLADVSTDPEVLRFQYLPAEDSPLRQSSAPKKKKAKAVYKEQDRFLPLHNVARAMRNAIPSSGKVSKDAKECMQECVSECVSFITSEASDKCIAERRKTITGDDILFAMATLGFDNYVEPMRLYLQKYREYSRAEKMNLGLSTPVDCHSFPSPDQLSAPVLLDHTHTVQVSTNSSHLQTDTPFTDNI